jgi:hypothetical protein
MTMDALERLRQAGQVERVDQAVLDEALKELAVAISGDARCISAAGVCSRGKARRRRSRRVTVTAAAAALAAAAVFAAVAWLGHSVPAIGPGKARPTSQGRSGTASHGSFSMAAILTAFTASSDDILMVTKIVHGEGTCCKTLMWISPARSAPGTAVRTRIQNFSTGGSRLSDAALSYTAPAAAPGVAGGGCDGIFLRPRVVFSPATGTPGRLTEVNYPGRVWGAANVRVQPATLPSEAPLRACLKNGQWRDVGQRTVGGNKQIELLSSGGHERLWVSAATFLPVRLTSTSPTPYGATTITFTFKFLRPTVANQAKLSPPPIPAGFSRQRL